MQEITIFKDIQNTSTPYYRDVLEILDRIKKGNSKLLVKKVRSAKDKEDANKYKRQLPSICFSGKFKVRNAKSCLEHSGFICLDFDKFTSVELMNEWRAKIIEDEHTFSLFTSPSGIGLKVIVKIPKSIEDHKGHFKSLEQYYKCEFFDGKTSDISRACFESHDPDIYINTNSVLYDDIIKDESYEYCERVPVLPLKSNSQILQKLQIWFDKNYSMSQGNRNQNLFIFASSLNEFGVDYNDTLSYLSIYKDKDFSITEIERTIKSAYSNKSKFGTKYFEDNIAKDNLKRKIKSGSEIKKIYKEFEEIYSVDQIDLAVKEIEENATVLEFWYANDKGKLHISNYKFKVFLEQNGFAKYYPENSEHFVFVKSENSFIEHTTADKIKDFVLDYLLEENETGVYEIMTHSGKHFKDDYLSLLGSITINFFEDTKEYGMLYYKNTAVKITKDGIFEIDYLNLDGMVWKHHVIDRNYKKSDFEGCYFDKFITFAGGGPKRKDAIKSAIGYLTHSHKTRANNKAIIFNDMTISENPNGGSGKGIICDAIGQLKRIFILDGKMLNFEKSFNFQLVNIETQVLVFDDVKKNFNFETLFSLITEGITLEKKNKDAIKVPILKSPKIVITTNYTINGAGGSFDRRKYEIELSDHFSEKHTPIDEFGIMLFDDFDKAEWSRFDNFMISCVQLYLEKGLIQQQYENLREKKLITQTCYDFFDWVTDGIQLNKIYSKSERFSEFVKEYPDYGDKARNRLSQKRFHSWLESYATYLKYELKNSKDTAGTRQFSICAPNIEKSVEIDQNEFDYTKSDEPSPF